MVFHCDLDLHLFDDYQRWASFHILIDHVFPLFEEISFWIFLDLFAHLKWVICHTTGMSMYILDMIQAIIRHTI